MIPAARNPGAPQEDASVQALRKHYEEDMKLHNTTRATLKDLGTQGDIEREREKQGRVNKNRERVGEASAHPPHLTSITPLLLREVVGVLGAAEFIFQIPRDAGSGFPIRLFWAAVAVHFWEDL